MEEKENEATDKIIDRVEQITSELLNTEGLSRENVDYFYKLVDIHKDLKNEKYWKVKEEKYNDQIQRKLWRKLRSI